MLGFIDTQTQWYLDKAEKLRKVTLQLENLHPDGMRRKQRRINKALHLMKFVMDLTRSAHIAFGDGGISESQEKLFEEAGTKIDATQDLVNEYYKKKLPSRELNYTKNNLYDNFWREEAKRQEWQPNEKRYSNCPNNTNEFKDFHP